MPTNPGPILAQSCGPILRTSRLRGNTPGAAAVPAPHDAEEDTTAQHDGDILRVGYVRAATSVVALVEPR